jgi:hypothetical protein
MKYDKEHTEKIIEALQNGEGRVRACKAAGISYETFTVWMEKPELSELVKKAEETGEDKIKDLAKRGIIEKFQEHWQAGAWWLERNYPDQYRQRIEQTGDPIIPNLGLSYEELCKLKYGKAGD